ncbi:Nhlrc4 [Phodopus roborovskii]|uniref:Nhlrc4 protein n=1 Tax=Phodopus roborovskii TaxID=109678 RepID=A0AAU9Z3B5_PHORO|nr:Nhlrc4 [Phodopus roborovskii]
MLGLEGPCWVGPGPDGGLAVSKEFRDVQLFGSAPPPFWHPAGVCSDSEGIIIVANEKKHQVTLFLQVGPHICLQLEGLERPLGMVCAPQGQLVMADAGDNCFNVYHYLGEMT